MSLFTNKFGLFVCCVALLSMSNTLFAAQDGDGAKDEVKQAADETEETSADDGSDDTTETAEKPAGFEGLMSQWQKLDARFNELAEQFKSETDTAKKASIRKEYSELVTEAEEIGEQLQDAAVSEYEKAPNKNEQVTKLLVGMTVDHIVFERRDKAMELADALINGGVDSSMLVAMRDSDRLSLEDMTVVDEIILRQEEHVADDLPQVKLETSKGDLVIELYENQAPGAVGNFVSLVEKGFYDGLTFHRVLDDFMAQGGDPDGDGTGDPGYKIKSEFDKSDARKHYRGVLSMANSGGKDTGGSQFFLVFAEDSTRGLNGKHTVFGRVISGMDNVDKIKRRNPANPDDIKITPDKIKKATVVRKRDHDYEPVKAGDE